MEPRIDELVIKIPLNKKNQSLSECDWCKERERERLKIGESLHLDICTYQAAPKIERPIASPIPMFSHARGLMQ